MSCLAEKQILFKYYRCSSGPQMLLKYTMTIIWYQETFNHRAFIKELLFNYETNFKIGMIISVYSKKLLIKAQVEAKTLVRSPERVCVVSIWVSSLKAVLEEDSWTANVTWGQLEYYLITNAHFIMFLIKWWFVNDERNIYC